MAGALVNEILETWEIQSLHHELKLSNLAYPRWRGNMFCFAYSKTIFGSSREPFFTIGPDWKFTLMEVILFNLLMLLPLRHVSPSRIYFQFCIAVLILQNFFFMLTVLVNPGMLSRDPTIHREDYLKNIAN